MSSGLGTVAVRTHVWANAVPTALRNPSATESGMDVYLVPATTELILLLVSEMFAVNEVWAGMLCSAKSALCCAGARRRRSQPGRGCGRRPVGRPVGRRAGQSSLGTSTIGICPVIAAEIASRSAESESIVAWSSPE